MLRFLQRRRTRPLPRRTLVLVDGRNVQRSTWPNPDAATLLRALDRWAEPDADTWEVVAVFDGTVADVELEHVAVVETRYADDELVALAREARAERRDVLAATSDRELRRRLEEVGVEVAWGGGGLLRELGLASRRRR